MRVLVANKFWYRRGGLERVMFDEIAWLEAAGHTTAHFSTEHPDNVPSPWSRYFVPYIELGASGSLSASQKLTAVARMFHNSVAARRFSALLTAFSPDVVHIHGIHRQISPSILATARLRGVPVVQTLHDSHHVCPADTLLLSGKTPCEPRRCRTYWYGAAVGHRCVRNSLGASALSAAETTYARCTRAYERGVRRFISPSNFLAEVMLAGGWSLPIDVIPNAVPLTTGRTRPGEGFVIIGRLAPEKGVAVALEAARRARVSVTVAGDGPLAAGLRADYPEVSFTGHLDGDRVAALVREARAVLVPSLWYENAPMSVLESMADGAVVIASAIGGIPEQVNSGVDGLLVPPNDPGALAAAMRQVDSDTEFAMRLGDAGVRTIKERFSPQAHVESLIDCYRTAGGRS